MMHFDLRQLHTYWNALYGGSGGGAVSETGQEMSAFLIKLDWIARASSGFEPAKHLNAPLRCGELEAALKKLHCDRAPGPDGLRAEHLRNAYSEVVLSNGKAISEYTLAPVLLYGALFAKGPYVWEWSLASPHLQKRGCDLS
jgi:hypothetical protein